MYICFNALYRYNFTERGTNQPNLMILFFFSFLIGMSPTYRELVKYSIPFARRGAMASDNLVEKAF